MCYLYTKIKDFSFHSFFNRQFKHTLSKYINDQRGSEIMLIWQDSNFQTKKWIKNFPQDKISDLLDKIFLNEKFFKRLKTWE